MASRFHRARNALLTAFQDHGWPRDTACQNKGGQGMASRLHVTGASHGKPHCSRHAHGMANNTPTPKLHASRSMSRAGRRQCIAQAMPKQAKQGVAKGMASRLHVPGHGKPMTCHRQDWAKPMHIAHSSKERHASRCMYRGNHRKYIVTGMQEKGGKAWQGQAWQADWFPLLTACQKKGVAKACMPKLHCSCQDQGVARHGKQVSRLAKAMRSRQNKALQVGVVGA
ncbi:hypothetical protein RHGRI_005008 [Rhododendron griersonianum]|uniref:Uncharacterized protein n=1 Tax=Rhododendron griersonianum TaxID=479676 RepID=A0AAV6LBP3_9ERIC|nr:hypothetical protein RHGRI_005008 [Rhododendron griersonianum]